VKNKNYSISILEDYSRLDEVYKITHDTFVKSGDISPQDNGRITTCPHLDHHPNTTILIAEQEGEIIGTITITVDSGHGLNMEKWFKEELTDYRQIYSSKLGSTWRLATDPSFRGKTRLIIDLISMAFKLLLEADCDLCLCALMNKHKKTYQRLMDAKVVVTKNVPFDKDIPMELNLMKIHLETGWDKFKQLQQAA
jgi:hypothetical protein